MAASRPGRPPSLPTAPAKRTFQLSQPQRWPIDAARPGRAGNRNAGPWVRFRWSEFRSAPQRGPGGVMPSASASPRHSGHSGHSAQPAARSPEAGALYLGKNEGEVPPPPDQDLRDPPHSQKKLTLAHRWLFGRGGQPQRWPIDVVWPGRATATMGHRCCCNRIHGPSLRFVGPAEQHRCPTDAVAARARRADCPQCRNSAPPAGRRRRQPGELSRLSGLGPRRPSGETVPTPM